MGEKGYWDSGLPTDDSQDYWQGTYRLGGPFGDGGDASGKDEPDGGAGVAGGASASHDGSMSARARRAYAAEALRSKDHISAGLLAIFLGVFGLHKFYLGCNHAGFIMLSVSIIGGILSFGLAAAVVWVIAIIEGAIYLTKSQTEFDRIYVLNQRDWF